MKIQCPHSVCDVSTYNQKQMQVISQYIGVRSCPRVGGGCGGVMNV